MDSRAPELTWTDAGTLKAARYVKRLGMTRTRMSAATDEQVKLFEKLEQSRTNIQHISKYPSSTLAHYFRGKR